MKYEEYALIPGLTASAIADAIPVGDNWNKSLRNFWWFHVLGKEMEKSASLDMGEAIHCSILENERFKQEYAVKLKAAHEYQDALADLFAANYHIDKGAAKKETSDILTYFSGLSDEQITEMGIMSGYAKSSALKSTKEKFQDNKFLEVVKNRIEIAEKAHLSGKESFFLKKEDMDIIQEMTPLVWSCEKWKYIDSLPGVVIVEQPYQFSTKIIDENGDENIIDCKIKPDWLKVMENRVIMIDLKSIHSIEAWEKHYVDYKYWAKMAFYYEGLQKNFPDKEIEVWLFFVEKKAPYAVHLHKPSKADLEYGSEMITQALYKIHENQMSGWEYVQSHRGSFSEHSVLKKSKQFYEEPDPEHTF